MEAGKALRQVHMGPEAAQARPAVLQVAVPPGVSQTDSAILHRIIGRIAGDVAAHGTKIIDSTGFSISRHQDWHNAKYGTISVKQFAKPRVAHTRRGTICAAAVAPGRANDSPHLRTMLVGCRADPATCRPTPNAAESKTATGRKGQWTLPRNRSQIRLQNRGGRRQAEMLRFLEEHPATFHKMPRKRNNVESVFSSMKERFGGVVRAVRMKIQTVELPSTRTCHNVTFA